MALNSGARLTFRGLDRKGAGVTGEGELTNLAFWVEAKYRAGWQWLEVFYDGEQVAGIVTRPIGRPRRTWWSEPDFG